MTDKNCIDKPSNRIVTVSNGISLFRVLLTVPILYFLDQGNQQLTLISIAIAVLSDMLDGWLARTTHCVSDLGKILDPIADKIVIFSVMLYLLLRQMLPVHFLAFLVLRDLTIAGTGYFYLRKRQGMPQANKFGKVSIIFTGAAILAYMFELVEWQKPLVITALVFLTISWILYLHTYLGRPSRARMTAGQEGASLQNALQKTERSIASRLPLLGRFFRIDEKTLEKIEETLIAADVGVEFTELLMDRLRQVDRGQEARLDEILKQEVTALLATDEPQRSEFPKPYVILVVGVNGTGKTTTIGKLAAYFKARNQSVLTVAADTFRAAAYDQLKVWAERANVDFLGNPQGKDPSAVAFDAVKSALAKKRDVVLIDTAGRLHTKSNLMEELAKIRRVIAKVLPEAPHDIWLVLDANTGQNGLTQARQFMQSVGLSGVILTKLDGTAKGGIVLSVHHKLQIPIRFLGVGEQIGDLVEFSPAEYVEALFQSV